MRRERDELLDTPLAQAADWMAIRRSGEMTELQAREFASWLNADPANRAAFDELLRIWEEAGEIREDPTILALRELNLRSFNQPVRRRLVGAAVAASLAAVGFGGWTLFGDAPLAPTSTTATLQEPRQEAEEQVLRTGVGQTTTAVLRDGSTVILDSDTLLLTSETKSRRSIHLERGGAYFQVAKDPSRPFVVEAAGKTITALGTAFEARVNAGKLDVTLVEGKVKVAAKKGQVWQGQQTMDMTAGWRLSAPDEKKWSLAKVDTKKELSWVSGRMSFFNDPLVEAAAKVNRYSEKQIIVDPSIAREPIVGVFESGDSERFVRGMELAGIARVGRVTNTTVELVAP